jgi:hypothetical protein
MEVGRIYLSKSDIPVVFDEEGRCYSLLTGNCLGKVNGSWKLYDGTLKSLLRLIRKKLNSESHSNRLLEMLKGNTSRKPIFFIGNIIRVPIKDV